MGDQRTHSNRLLLLAGFMATIGLTFDLAMPLGVAGGVPYVAVVLVSLWPQRQRVAYFVAVGCTVLTIIGYYGSPEGGIHWVVLTNRALAVGAIWAAAILGDRWIGALREQRRLHDRVQQLFAEQKELSAQLRTISKRIITTQEEERQQIARELHDSLGQLLTGVLTHLERVESAQSREKMLDATGHIYVAARQALDGIHEISNFLRPVGLDDLGLREAIATYVAEFKNDSGIHVKLSVDFREDSIPFNARLHIFRILQEALRNVRRHANARNITIALSNSSGGFHLIIEDDGIGFAVDRVDFYKHHGILGMQERARYLDATLALTPAEEAGTRVELHVPMLPTDTAELSDG